MRHYLDYIIEESTLYAEKSAVAAGTADKAAQNIAAAFIRGHYAVGNKERGSAHMVCDDTHGNVGFLILPVLYARLFADGGDDILNGIDIKHAVHSLHYAGETLESHAGIYIFLSKLGIVAVAVIIELRENIIPYFHVSVTVTAGLAVGLAAAVFFAAIEIYLGAGTAGTAAVLPEVVLLTEADYTLGGDADLFVPYFKSLVILFVDGGPEPVLGDFENLGEKFPCPRERLFFEIIAEGKVAEHLEICAVACRISDIFYIVCAYATLAGRHAAAGRSSFTREILFERSHARDYEQKRLVALGNKRIAVVAEMPL